MFPHQPFPGHLFISSFNAVALRHTAWYWDAPGSTKSNLRLAAAEAWFGFDQLQQVFSFIWNGSSLDPLWDGKMVAETKAKVGGKSQATKKCRKRSDGEEKGNHDYGNKTFWKISQTKQDKEVYVTTTETSRIWEMCHKFQLSYWWHFFFVFISIIRCDISHFSWHPQIPPS